VAIENEANVIVNDAPEMANKMTKKMIYHRDSFFLFVYDHDRHRLRYYFH
jgi:hypothetical protein